MEFKFITGKMGTGKSELARVIARSQGRRCSIFELEENCNQNFFDKYFGEECIILDDAKHCCELLPKLMVLNNSNFSQFLTCKMVIITSCLDIDSFCNEVFKEDTLLIKQFKSLCQYRIKTSLGDF